MTASIAKQGAASSLSINAPVDVDPFPEPSGSPTQSQRHAMIAEAAFFIAQERGFEPGHELDDWMVAERQVDQQLSADLH